MNTEIVNAVNPLVNLMLFISNRGIEDFAKMYSKAFEAEYNWKENSFQFNWKEFYIQEKFEAANKNFLSWYRNLDNNIKARFLNYVEEYYKNV